MSINVDRKKRLKTEKIDTATDQSIDGNESRALRSGYLSIQNYIRDQKDQIAAASSMDFLSIIKEVDGMHHREMAQKSVSEEILDETKTSLRRNLLSGPNFNDWFRSLRIFLRVMERLEIVSTPMIPMPAENASQAEQDNYKETYKKYDEVACLMLSSMTPELVKQFEQKWSDQMITELRALYEKQAGLELNDLIRDVHACHHVSETLMCKI